MRVTETQRQAFAFAVDDPATFSLRLDPEAEGELYLSVHAASLDELGLRPGAQEVATPGELAYPIPPPTHAYQAGRAGARLIWTVTEEARAQLRRTWLRGQPLQTLECPEISVRAFRLPVTPPAKRWISVAEHLGDGRVLVSTEYGEWMTVTRDGIRVEPTLSASVAHASSFRGPGDRVWLAHCEPEGLFSIDPRLEYDRPIRQDCGRWTSGPEQVVRMDGAPSGLSRELVTMTRGGVVTLWDEAQQPTRLYDLGRQVLLQFPSWVEPGRAVIAKADDELIFVAPDQPARPVRPDWRDRDAPPKLYRARRFPEGLAVVGEDGAQKGLVLFQDLGSESWWILGQTGVVGALYQILPTDDGFVYAGQGRQLGWWTRQTGFCDAPAIGPPGEEGRPAWELGSHSFYILVPVSEDEMFVAGFVTLSETADTVWWLRRHR